MADKFYLFIYFNFFCSPNVCTEREEQIEEPEDKKNSSSSDVDSQFASAFHLNFETCFDKANKHVCKTV